MRVALLLALAFGSRLTAADPVVVARPDAFKTLVNPNCSHCIDESKRRAADLRDDDPVLAWTRGYSDGGAIPVRFFLNPYRVISDSYGVFVYDPDAGYARGFAPSFHFTFHGWCNGVMVMKHKDGTLYSCLTGVAFDGPRKGDRLAPVPTLTTTWGHWMERYPNAVAYQMFDKYTPTELPKAANPDSVRSRPTKTDPRLKPDELVLGVRVGDKTKAYPMARFETIYVQEDEVGGHAIWIFKHGSGAIAAYRPVASPPRKFQAPRPDKDGVSPPDEGGAAAKPRKLSGFKDSKLGPLDHDTDSAWDVVGRAREGALKGWTLEPVDAVVCKWFAWSAEYTDTVVYGVAKPDAEKEVAGTAEFLRVLPKPFAKLVALDAKARTVTLLLDGDKTAKVWPLEPDAEVKVAGWWGRLEQFKPGDRVWAWLKLNRKKEPVSVVMLADEASELDIHGIEWLVTAVDVVEGDAFATFTLTAGEKKQTLRGDLKELATAVPGTRLLVQTSGGRITRFAWANQVEEKRTAQKAGLRKRWLDEGLPGTLTFSHVFSGELELTLDHEAMRWGRGLKLGDVAHLTADPPIRGVVKAVSPWRERTVVRLVVGELEASELRIGQRLNLKVTPPTSDDGAYPPDIDRVRSGAERVEWFLANVYCVCGVGKDTCTGHFYTLASCNPNGCGAPASTRAKVRELIDAGKTDRQIWDELLKARGPLMLKPHLKP